MFRKSKTSHLFEFGENQSDFLSLGKQIVKMHDNVHTLYKMYLQGLNVIVHLLGGRHQERGHANLLRILRGN